MYTSIAGSTANMEIWKSYPSLILNKNNGGHILS
jgi:hypothetical protein